MGKSFARALILSALTTSLTWAQVPVVDEAAAEAKAKKQASQLTDLTGREVQAGKGVQSTSYDSLYKASVDNMMNGQMGQATAFIFSNSLETEASSQTGSCDPSTTDGLAACTTASLLMGMASLAEGSGNSFEDPINTAWSNVCQFSSKGCTAEVPNPYSPLVGASPGLTPDKVTDVIETLLTKGFTIHPKTGVVTSKTGAVIDPNNYKSIKSALGDDKSKTLMDRVQGFEKSALSKVQKISKSAYIKALGLLGLNLRPSDLASSSPSGDETSGLGKLNSSKKAVTSGLIPQGGRRLPACSESRFSVSYNGEKIGVACDSIFKIVTRRYQVKILEKSFWSPQMSQMMPSK